MFALVDGGAEPIFDIPMSEAVKPRPFGGSDNHYADVSPAAVIGVPGCASAEVG